MRKFLTSVGVCVIAGVISVFMVVIVDKYDLVNVRYDSLLSLFIFFTLSHLFLTLPIALGFDVSGWFSRFGFVKRIIVFHLIVWGVVALLLSVVVLSNEDMSFMEAVSVPIVLLSIFPLPITLGAIIMNWLIYGTQGLSQFKSKFMVRVRPPKTLDFAEYGKWKVVGQDYAIDTIQRVLIANTKLADRGDPRRNRILASFLFVGPTGVGKTETAKALADWLRQDGYDFLRIDANQYADSHSLWTLLGSAKGYKDSDTPGLLPYAISQNPKLVILIDEIEKADQGFYQFLLQMLDEGYVIERSTGYAYYLKRAIVIITSNLENQKIAKIMETLSNPIEIDIAVRKTLENAVVWLGDGRTFRITPEFLGRIDAVIPFRSLGFEDLVQIAYRDIRGLGVDITIERARELTQKYYPVAKEYGVRYFLKKIREDVLTQ
jgi:GTPase SAR1 family protein